MKKPGRPRQIRSQPTSGVGGHTFTPVEIDKLLDIAEAQGLDREDQAAGALFIDLLLQKFNSYLAYKEASSKQVGVKDEMFDRDTIVARAKRVLFLVESQADLLDAHACIPDAHSLSSALGSFPMVLRAYASALEPDFMNAKLGLQCMIVRVALWPAHRAEFTSDLKLLIEVCERLEEPAGFTKRAKSARDSFEAELKEIYLEILHPKRLAAWAETRKNHPDEIDPPPLRRTEAFPLEVMKALDVPFEVKGRRKDISG